jgi:hypothetical protein
MYVEVETPRELAAKIEETLFPNDAGSTKIVPLVRPAS